MSPIERIKITESPRDAQQGLPYVISPEKRASFVNALLKVNYDVIDVGSFVSEKAIPQMASQSKVFDLIDKSLGDAKLMVIVGNLRGGKDASAHPKTDILGFPYSMSENFLLRNINSTISKANDTITDLSSICSDKDKELRIFISMAFGNPYGDKWNLEELQKHISRFIHLGVKTITLSDTIGVATPDLVTELFERLIPLWPDIEFGLHIHTKPRDWNDKIQAAWDAGCRSYDGVLNGIGGCPMTGYELLGNLNTLNLWKFIVDNNIPSKINETALAEALTVSGTIYEMQEFK